MSLIAQKLISASGATEETDDDFNLVTGLYHFDGSNGGQNNTYVDSSSTSKTLTCSSNLFQGTFSPFSADEGKWSVIFDGTDDYLEVASSSDFDYTSSLCVDGWFYMTETPGDTSNAHCIVSRWAASSGDRAFLVDIESDGLRVLVNQGGSTNVTVCNPGSSGAISLNVWHHFALTWDGTTYRAFLDGGLEGSATGNAAPTGNGKVVRIGYNSNNHYFGGYISNVRIVVDGGAIYTSAFTPPTTPSTAISGTELLTSCSNRFKDKSTSARSITTNSTPKILPFSPFKPNYSYSASSKGGSAYWPTETDKTNKITLSSSADFAFGTGAFTIEAWVYVTADTNSYSRVWQVGPYFNDNNSVGLAVDDTANSSKISFWAYAATGTGRTCISTNATPRNEWFHVAVTRDSTGDFRLFVNGNLDSTNTSYRTTNISPSGNQTFCIGNIVEINATLEAEACFEGYISNLRVVKGTAIYTSSFTPPTAPVTDVTNTKLLANFTNASIIDSTGKNNVETGANAQLDTTVKKFGTASYESDGSTSSFLTLSNSDMFPTGFSPFTIEGFIYINSPHKNYNNIISLGFGIQMYVDNTGKLICWLGNSSGGYFVNGLQSTATISLSTWTHIALVRNSVYPFTSNTVTWFVNGTAGGQTTEGVSNSIVKVGTYNTFAAIGAYPTGSYIYDGFLDELRITNKARYTSNFTAPTEEFPNL